MIAPVDEICNEAYQIYVSDIRPEQNDREIENIRLLLDQGLKISDVAKRLKLPESRVKKLR